jgi:hypothetical protein
MPTRDEKLQALSEAIGAPIVNVVGLTVFAVLLLFGGALFWDVDRDVYRWLARSCVVSGFVLFAWTILNSAL